VSIGETTKEIAKRPFVVAADTMRHVGMTALELIDSERLVNRLSAEQQVIELEIALQTLDYARAAQDEEMMQAGARHVVRVVTKRLVLAVHHEEHVNGKYLRLIKELFDDDLSGCEIESLGLSEPEKLLLRGLS
jgi:hypothetical protein